MKLSRDNAVCFVYEAIRQSALPPVLLSSWAVSFGVKKFLHFNFFLLPLVGSNEVRGWIVNLPHSPPRCVCVCLFVKLHTTEPPGPFILIFECYTVCVFHCVLSSTRACESNLLRSEPIRSEPWSTGKRVRRQLFAVAEDLFAFEPSFLLQ